MGLVTPGLSLAPPVSGRYLPTTPGTQVEWSSRLPRRGPRQLVRHLYHLARRAPAWCAYCPRPAPLSYLSPAARALVDRIEADEHGDLPRAVDPGPGGLGLWQGP